MRPAERAPEDHGEALVQLPVQCGSCGRREARRVVASRLALYRDLDPSRVLETVKCQGCGSMYFIRAAAYQQAQAAEDG